MNGIDIDGYRETKLKNVGMTSKGHARRKYLSWIIQVE